MKKHEKQRFIDKTQTLKKYGYTFRKAYSGDYIELYNRILDITWGVMYYQDKITIKVFVGKISNVKFTTQNYKTIFKLINAQSFKIINKLLDAIILAYEN